MSGLTATHDGSELVNPVNVIKEHSENRPGWATLRQYFEKQRGVIRENIHLISSYISELNYQRHSLGVLYLLVIKGERCSSDTAGTLLQEIRQLFLVGDISQLQHDTRSLYALCHTFADLGIQMKASVQCVKPLRRIVKEASSGQHVLTAAHPLLLKACLVAKCYDAASGILDLDIYEVDHRRNGIDPIDFLLYYYYGGLIYIGCKQFEKALDFFQMAITTPASVLSAIVVEAYKKHLLVSLLICGEIKGLPKYTSTTVSNVFQRHGKVPLTAYHEFAKRVTAQDWNAAKAFALERQDVFKRDHNYGLVKQCLDAIQRRKIEELKRMYFTVNIQEAIAAAGSSSWEEAEQIILRMVESGQLQASIVQPENMIKFTEAYDRNDYVIQAKLRRELDYMQTISLRLQGLDHSIVTDHAYVQKQMRRPTADGGDKPGGVSLPSLSSVDYGDIQDSGSQR